MEYTHHYDSPLGGITMASDGKALTGLWFDGQKYFGAGLSPEHEKKALPIFERTSAWLDIYFSGREPDFTPELNLKGSEFRKSVWKILLTIPYGKTTTYGAIGRRIAEERAADALPSGFSGEADRRAGVMESHLTGAFETHSAGAPGIRMSPQAVGGAVGHNPIALIVPCHRVIGADGRLTGYAGGLDRKQKLLQLEQAGFLL